MSVDDVSMVQFVKRQAVAGFLIIDVRSHLLGLPRTAHARKMGRRLQDTHYRIA